MEEMTVFEQIMKFIEQFQVVIYPLLIAAYAVGYKFYKEMKQKKADIDKEVTASTKAKNLDKYRQWEHEHSLAVLSKIRDLCNYYKDLGAMDLVSYLQLENGTMATSKLCNMFVSCVAEDNRFGRLQKQIGNLQRIPCSTILDWVLGVQTGRFMFGNIDDIEEQVTKDTFISQKIQSSIALGVNDPEGYFIGACVFDYADKGYNNQDLEKELNQINQLKVGIQTIFFNYHMSRNEKRKELNIEPGYQEERRGR